MIAILADIKKRKGGPAFGFKAPFINTLEAVPPGEWPGRRTDESTKRGETWTEGSAIVTLWTSWYQ